MVIGADFGGVGSIALCGPTLSHDTAVLLIILPIRTLLLRPHVCLLPSLLLPT